VARLSPLVAGVDLAGVVVAVDGEAKVKVGDEVLAHGGDIGTGRHGGYAHYCRLPASMVLKVPAGLTMREAMIIGTAGFTAAQSVHALERHGIRTDGGPVLVTGATGGVGSAAIGILAQRGYEVVASTGKSSEADFLLQLRALNGRKPRRNPIVRWKRNVGVPWWIVLAVPRLPMRFVPSNTVERLRHQD
jgi:acrylyl-CoA reductase (NADPH)